MTADVRIGVSGWTYAPWRGEFFPRGLAQKDELAYEASVFRAVEVNGTFYGSQTPNSFGRWFDQTPDDFIFTVKAPRFITHVRRLREPRAPVANFIASGLLRLGAKLGPILWQFPPNFRFDAKLMEEFVALLPRDPDGAIKLGRRHDRALRSDPWLQADGVTSLRHAIEIRHESFRNAEFIKILRDHQVALVCADTVAWPRLMDLTADFVYCRLHGSEELYRSGYNSEALDRWAARVRAWRSGHKMEDGEFVDGVSHDGAPRDVFMFFDNTDKRRAPHDAQALMARIEQGGKP